jgi:hypothetical protein
MIKRKQKMLKKKQRMVFFINPTILTGERAKDKYSLEKLFLEKWKFHDKKHIDVRYRWPISQKELA